MTCCYFFFQAEDGIRDSSVTGVQTCALPICDVGPGEGEDAIEAFGEIGGAAARGVINVPVFPVDARIRGPATQTLTEKFVANSGRRKIALHRHAMEFRKTRTGGAAAEIT